MRHRRFTSKRVVRIIGWTTALVAWGSALGGRALGILGEPDTEPTPLHPSEVLTAPVAPPLPAAPNRGLVVIRTPLPDRTAPTPITRRVVVQGAQVTVAAPTRPTAAASPAPAPAPVAAAPAPAPAAAPAPVAKSSGS
jgi:hypothetical protein